MTVNTEFDYYDWSNAAFWRRIEYMITTYAPLEWRAREYLQALYDRTRDMSGILEQNLLQKILADRLQYLINELLPNENPFHELMREEDCIEMVLSMPEHKLAALCEKFNGRISQFVCTMQFLERMMDLHGDRWPDEIIVAVCRVYGIKQLSNIWPVPWPTDEDARAARITRELSGV